MMKTQHENTVIEHPDMDETSHRGRADYYHGLFDRAPLPYQSLDEDGKLIEVNQAWLNMMGCTKEAALGHYFGDFMKPKSLPVFEITFATSIQQGFISSPIYEIIRKDNGKRVLVVVNGQIDHDPDGKFVRTQCILTDVTAREQAEAEIQILNNALSESHKHFDRMMATVPVMLYDCLLYPDGGSEYLYVSPRCLDLLELAEEELLTDSSRLDSLIHADDLPLLREQERAALASGTGFHVEVRITTASGVQKWIQISSNPNDMAPNTPAIWTGSIADISARKQTEAELARYQKHLEELVVARTEALNKAKTEAEAANIAKSAFLDNMTHELRTPLNAITGMAYLIKHAGLNDKQMLNMAKLEESSHALLLKLNNVLELSRLESGRAGLIDEDFSLDRVVNDVTVQASAQAQGKGLSLRVDCCEMPHHLRGDATCLTHILINYLNNAIKFTEQGEVVLRGRVLESTQADMLLRFEVQDSGIGLSEEQMERVFGPFEQADNSRTRRFGGMGLGLTLNHHLANLLDGEVGVDSQPDQGSLFWFTARMKRAAPRRDKAVPQVSVDELSAILQRDLPGRRILVAENEPFYHEILSFLLEDAGQHVEVANTDAQVVEKLANTFFDLILLDPNLIEPEVIHAALSVKGANTPIIGLDDELEAMTPECACQRGLNALLKMPIDPNDLYIAVFKWLR